MSDARLAILRRAWEASGSLDDEASYLLERVRSGDLTQSRLEAAADFGAEAAVLALGREGRVPSLHAALIALQDKERIAVGCDCAERSLHLWARYQPDDVRPQTLLEHVRAWVAGVDAEDAIHQLTEDVWNCQNPHEVDPATRAARAVYWLGSAVSADAEEQAESCAEVFERVVHALSEAAWETSYANGEYVADLKQEQAANVERRWQRSRVCHYLLRERRLGA